jgi:hypothetical protein
LPGWKKLGRATEVVRNRIGPPEAWKCTGWARDEGWQPRPSRLRLPYAGEPEKLREVVSLAGIHRCRRNTVRPR